MADTPRTNEQVQASVGLDATPFEQGAKKVVDVADKMAQGVGKAADSVGGKVGGMGDGAGRGAEKIDRATKSIIASIERATAVTQAGERGTSSFYEKLSNIRGVDQGALKPYIEQLRQAEIAQRASILGLDKMGLTAKQTKAALQQVPAQFTDIITSLQGGQAPLTVLLQQGGQLKDVFGGVGAAARALGGYIIGLVNPYTVAAAGAAGLAIAWNAGREESAAYAKSIILTGNAAGTTASQLSAMALAIDKTAFGITQGKAAEVIALIASSAMSGAANIRLMAQAAIEMERAGGPAATETAKAFAELARAPLQASLKLNEAQNYLTRSTYEQIKALEEQGLHVEAARVAQEALATATLERAPQMAQQLGYVERAWKGISGAISEAWDKTKNIGRDGGTVGALREAESLIGPGQRRTYVGEMANIAALEQGAKYEALSAFYTGQQAQQVKLLADYRKDEAQYLTPLLKYQMDVTRAVNEGVAAYATSEEIQLRVAAANKKYNDSLKSETGAANRELEAESDLLARLAGLTTTYNNDIERLNNLRARGRLNEEQYTKAVQDLVAIQPYMVKYTKEQADAESARFKDAERYAQAQEKAITAAEREVANLQAQYIELVAGKAVRNELQAARLEEEATLLEIQSIRQVDKDLDVTEFEARKVRINLLRQEAALRRGIATATDNKEVDAANAKAAEHALREWERTADQIGRGLADAIIQGGDSAAQYLKRLFSSMVLQPMVQAIVQPYVNAGLGALGYAQPAGAGGNSAYGKAVQAAGVYNAAGGLSGVGLSAANYAGTAYANVTGTGIDGLLATNGAYGTSAGYASMSSYASLAAAIAAGVWKANQDYSQGFNVGGARQVGRDTYGMVGTYEAQQADILAALGFSDRLSSLLSGSTAVAKIIGRAAPRITEGGITGTIGGGDFTGDAYQHFYEKGGILRRSKSYDRTVALPEEIGRLLDESAKSVLDKAKGYGVALGLPATALDGLTKDIKIVLGKDAEANKKAILDSLSAYGDALVAGWAEALKPVAQYGETAAQTVERVAGSLTTVNEIMKQLGLTLFDASITGAKAAVSLGDVFGGLDTLQAASKSYYESFYTDAEKTAKATESVTTALAAVGLAMPTTRDGFRAMVEAADLTTEAGRTQYATLLGVADAFAQITDSAQKLLDAGDGVVKFIAELRGQAGGVASLQSARALYGADLLAARGGDIGATGRITSSAKALVDLIREGAADPMALARETSRIAAQLSSLPAVVARQNAGMDALALDMLGGGSTTSGAASTSPATQMTTSMQSMQDELASQRAALEAIAKATAKTAALIDRAMPDGDAFATREVAV